MKTAQLAFGWILVGIPLIYGIITTLMKVSALFG
ncbi:MFS transporter small subunit [Sinomonas puerhi]